MCPRVLRSATTFCWRYYSKFLLQDWPKTKNVNSLKLNLWRKFPLFGTHIWLGNCNNLAPGWPSRKMRNLKIYGMSISHRCSALQNSLSFSKISGNLPASLKSSRDVLGPKEGKEIQMPIICHKRCQINQIFLELSHWQRPAVCIYPSLGYIVYPQV